MPFANATILATARDRLLETEADVVIPQTQAGYEPFHAVYRRETCLQAVEAALQSGEQRLISWFPAVSVVPIPPDEIARFDPLGLAFWNVNTPEEFQQAEAILQSGLSQ
jgi:molybdopterin-guanine dinucleotide biosynthesis protein A